MMSYGGMHCAVEAVLLKKFSCQSLNSSLNHSDQYLLLHFCSKVPVSFPPALWKKCLKNEKKRLFPKLGVPMPGIEPLPLRWETDIQPNRLWGMLEEISLKAIIYLIFQNFKCWRKTYSKLRAKMNSKYWSECLKHEFELWQENFFCRTTSTVQWNVLL